jgi:hypothetical protein
VPSTDGGPAAPAIPVAPSTPPWPAPRSLIASNALLRDINYRW